MSLRRPVWALYVLIVGLAVHNLVMSQLWRAGVRGGALSAIAGWKDVLLLVALGLVVWHRRGLPFDRSYVVDWLALAFGAFVVVYAVLPQSWLGGGATHKGVLYAARHDLLPVEAYFLGRGLELTSEERRRVCRVRPGDGRVRRGRRAGRRLSRAALVVAPLAGVVHGINSACTYKGLSGLPENFVYNEGGGVVFRRLTSTFLSPLATAYLLVVALLFVPLRGRRWGWPLAALLFAALLWTHTRAALLALVLALLVLAVLRRRLFFVGLAVAVRGDLLRVRAGVRPHRPAHAFHEERARLPGATRARDAGQEQRRDERERGVDQRAPVELPRRCAHRVAPPVGIRPRQRRGDGGSDARDDRSGRVDLHRAGGRDRARRRA